LELVQPLVKNYKFTILVNSAWEEGMASSIRVGVAALSGNRPSTDNVIFMVCDQPFVSSRLLNEMIYLKEKSKKKIIACTYENPLEFRQYLTGLFSPL
jgi:molybdenum cofactor cytidylyltransferase